MRVRVGLWVVDGGAGGCSWVPFGSCASAGVGFHVCCVLGAGCKLWIWETLLLVAAEEQCHLRHAVNRPFRAATGTLNPFCTAHTERVLPTHHVCTASHHTCGTAKLYESLERLGVVRGEVHPEFGHVEEEIKKLEDGR